METAQAESRETTVENEVPTIIEEGPTLPQILETDFVERFEKGIAIYKRWVSACFRLTRESHWIDHGKPGKPKYSLQGPGAEALMNPLGISFEAPHTKQAPLENGGYAYWVEGYVESKTLNRRGYYIGYCDSRDPFFNARPGWKPETGHGDVRKAATTNWIVNAVTRIAGLRDPDPEMLKSAGLDPAKITHIDYSGGGRTQTESNDTISEAQGKRLFAIAKGQRIDEDGIAIILNRHGYAKIEEIKRKDYEKICKAVETRDITADRAYLETKGSQGAAQ